MAKRASRRLTVRRVPDEEAFELVLPPCAEECAEDMEEVRAMLAAGETDVAVDELRWLVEQCGELLEAHQLLGEIALEDGDLPLARGHFGRAFELGLAAFSESGPPGLMPGTRGANRALFEAGKGLARCYHESGKAELAAEVVDQLLALDPGDPLRVKDLLTDTG
ncbi:MAG: hypothetical protein HQ582_33950 [Planctomycetes bacterium]|nr:hypothetical protein [Planctomycetota bacterium]